VVELSTDTAQRRGNFVGKVFLLNGFGGCDPVPGFLDGGGELGFPSRGTGGAGQQKDEQVESRQGQEMDPEQHSCC
jgi:hypothetical protein